MAVFFKFRTVDELDAESQRLGLDLRFSSDFSPLFAPVALGALTAGNALCIQPMEGCDGTLDGKPGELTYRRYRRFGAGGAKLTWGEAAAVADEGRANPASCSSTGTTPNPRAQMVRECRQRTARRSDQTTTWSSACS
ncbi:MAG: hypothetical protein U0736_20820 [Gemmataceae bacterium]